MSHPKEIEEAFLSLIQKDNSVDEHNKRIEYFTACDWDELYELAIRSALFPVFYKRLKNLQNIPAQFYSKLKNLYLLSLRRNLLLEQELFKITDYFHGLNITVIPLKGPVLARYLYNDLALRQASCDLDLLVPYGRIEEIENGLRDLGYALADNSRQRLVEKLRYTPAVSLKKDFNMQESISLDLHKNIRRFLGIDPYPQIWENIRLFNLGGHQVWIPHDEDLLLYLSMVSISTFEFVELKYVYDVHNLVSLKGETLNWQDLSSKAERAGVAYALYFALRLSQEFFKTNIPTGFLKRIKPKILKEMFFRVWVNKNNILNHRREIAFTYTWRYFISRYLYAKNLLALFKKFYCWLFLANEDNQRMYADMGFIQRLYLSTKRLFKPLISTLCPKQ